ncbi:arylamine N-acetyltransferase [Umezawaea endophytica]|uniref:Arylamine N-acetyltransferase n=1 Tax=Umezawaea endophytica TaxID=1654476 RepID=A0A9X3ADA8_9PSEU|nr:arylamine N-acetyltransferase [Umezawaea endophytica]MCS7475967.1 arylamine N-acetyltransferase [Umezawaea endophytica]
MDAVWGGAELDLDAYLARIGYDGDRAPTAGTLRAVQRAHVTSIPWENLDMVLARPVDLAVPALQAKLVHGTRGGTCSEHTTLFAAALDGLGFPVTGMQGRVRLGGTAEIFPSSHNVLRVTADDRVWLCDAGFGAGPLEPVELADGAESAQGGWRYRLTRDAPEWVLHSWRVDRWLAVHAFTESPRYPIDFLVSNHFIATHPRSHFHGRVVAQRMGDDRLVVLEGTRLTTHHQPAGREDRELAPAEVITALADVFGVVLEDDDAKAVITALGG